MDSLIKMAFNQNTLAGLIILLLSSAVIYFIRSFLLKSKENDEKHYKKISDLKEMMVEKNNEFMELLNSQAAKINRHSEVLDKNQMMNVSDQMNVLSKELNNRIVDIELEIGKDIISLKSKYNELDKISENDRLAISRVYSTIDKIKDQVDNANNIIRQVLEQKVKMVEETSKNSVEINKNMTSFVREYESTLAILINEKDGLRISQNQYEKELIQLRQDFDKNMIKYTEELSTSIKNSNNTDQFKIVLVKLTSLVKTVVEISNKTKSNTIKVDEFNERMSSSLDRLSDINLSSKKTELAMSELRHDLNNKIHKNGLEISRIKLNLERGLDKPRKV